MHRVIEEDSLRRHTDEEDRHAQGNRHERKSVGRSKDSAAGTARTGPSTVLADGPAARPVDLAMLAGMAFLVRLPGLGTSRSRMPSARSRTKRTLPPMHSPTVPPRCQSSASLRQALSSQSDSAGCRTVHWPMPADIADGPRARFRPSQRPPAVPPGFRPWWQAEVTRPIQPQTAVVPVAPTGLVLAALAHSAQIRALNESVFISQSAITEAEGKFDPRAFAESRLVADSDPVGNTLTTGGPNPWIDTHWYGSAGIRKQGLSGAQLEVSQQIGYEDSNSLYFVAQSPGHGAAGNHAHAAALERCGHGLQRQRDGAGGYQREHCPRPFFPRPPGVALGFAPQLLGPVLAAVGPGPADAALLPGGRDSR